MYVPAERVTSQGYDLQFGTNVLGTQRGSPYRATSHPQTYDRRPLLSHQTPSPCPHGDRKEGACEVRACGQCELSGPLFWSPGGYPMDLAQPRDGIA
jgi:hypothetical protein